MTPATAAPERRSRTTPLHDPLITDELARVLAKHCAEQFAAVAGPARDTLIDLQVRARLGGFTASYPRAMAWLLLRDGHTAGYAIVDDTGTAIRLVDLVVHPAFRRSGVATGFLDELAERADAAGRAVELTVAPASDAERLYLARGFTPAAEPEEPGALHRALRREPASVPEPEEGTR